MEFIKKVSNNDKIILRSEIKSRFANYDHNSLEAMSRQLFNSIEALPQFISAQRVGLYVSLPDEPSTEEFIERWSEHKHLFFPVVEGDTMQFCEFTGQWHRGRFCNEPTGEPCSGLDLIIVPAVAFDSQGYRLGRGGGYYDRYLAIDKVFTIGVCFPFTLQKQIPAQSHDIPVNMVVCQ